MLVNQRLKISANTERILLHGVGCAGGLAMLRVAAQIACGATSRGRPARILAYACELCTPNVRHDLAEAAAADGRGIAAVLFSDAAAAFVICNDYGLGDDVTPLLEVVEWGNMTLPDTLHHLNSFNEPDGFRTILTHHVPRYTSGMLLPLFQKLIGNYREKVVADVDVQDFDWALHPGGKAIISGAKDRLAISDTQLRAT